MTSTDKLEPQPSGLLPTGPLARLGRLHDGLTWATFWLAVVCLAVIIVAFCVEVFSRYVLNAPTTWANAVSSYLLCIMIFAALPEMTRSSAHVAITMLLDRLPAAPAQALRTALTWSGVVACLLAAWITGADVLAQWRGDIWTIQSYPVPKWLISAFLPYGFVSAGLYFLRHALHDPRLPEPEGMGL